MGGQIRVSFPQAFNLPESLRVYAAGGVLGTATSVEASVDPLAKVVSVVVHGGIPQGSLSFSLGDVTTPIGSQRVASSCRPRTPGCRLVCSTQRSITCSIRWTWRIGGTAMLWRPPPWWSRERPCCLFPYRVRVCSGTGPRG